MDQCDIVSGGLFDETSLVDNIQHASVVSANIFHLHKHTKLFYKLYSRVMALNYMLCKRMCLFRFKWIKLKQSVKNLIFLKVH